MKKLLALLLAAAMLLSLCACGSPSKPKELEDISDEDWEAAAEALEDMYEEEPVEETEPAQKIYQIGDTIVSSNGMLEFTFDSFGFADVIDNYETAPATADSTNPINLVEEKTFFYYSGTLNLVEESKQTVKWSLSDIILDYDDGYQYNQDARSDTRSNSLGSYCAYNEDGTACRKLGSSYFEPLVGGKVKQVRGYIEIPALIETDTESPLLLNMILSCWVGDDGDVTKTYFTIQLR